MASTVYLNPPINPAAHGRPWDQSCGLLLRLEKVVVVGHSFGKAGLPEGCFSSERGKPSQREAAGVRGPSAARAAAADAGPNAGWPSSPSSPTPTARSNLCQIVALLFRSIVIKYFCSGSLLRLSAQRRMPHVERRSWHPLMRAAIYKQKPGDDGELKSDLPSVSRLGICGLTGSNAAV